jgi:2-polyprenyl-6-hydroxyphenyl methylase / 3-demethylubiquinone-9 3-methyltransferase
MVHSHDSRSSHGSGFSRFAADWWDRAGPLRTLHVINPVRLDYIKQRIDLPGKRVLDLGCGGGLLTEAMATCGARVTGADLSDELIEAANVHSRQLGLDIEYVQGDAQAVLDAKGPASFDALTCLEMLEHVDEPGKVVNTCAQLVKPGGDIVFSTLDRNPKSWLLAIVGAEYIAGLLPRGTHDYSHFIRPAELAACARACDMEVLDISGLVYLPGLNKAMISHRPGVNYLLHARRSHT